MNLLTQLTLLAWTPAALTLFFFAPPRTAALWTVILGVLFLPNAGFDIPNFIDFNKSTAIALACLVGIGVTDTNRLLRIQPSWFDLPIILFLVAPAASALSQGYGAYATVSWVITYFLRFVVPYLVGRWYFSDLKGHQQLVVAILLGALIYLPLCLFEIRMSPQLHNIFYGFHQHSFSQTARGSGFRPVVFMQHGLMVGLWMAVGSVVGLALWRSRAVRSVLHVPMPVIALGLIGTTVLCKSTGATLLMLIGMLAIWEGRLRQGRLLLTITTLAVGAYLSLRTVLRWDAPYLVKLASQVSADRAESLQYRLRMEGALLDYMGGTRLLGKGPTGFSQIGADATATTDSLWIIFYATCGLLGLVAMYAAFALPVLGTVLRLPRGAWLDRRYVSTMALALCLMMFLVDCIANAMLNPVYLLVMGGLTGFLSPRDPTRSSASDPL